MNKLFILLCMVSLLVFHTSCQEIDMDLDNPSTELNTRAIDQRVQNLIQQARNGETEAYKSLALCYRDGDGVEKSWLNMVCMYGIYCKKTGGDIDSVVELFEEGHPFRLLTEFLNSSSPANLSEEKLTQLKAGLPLEVMAIEACMLVDKNNDFQGALGMLQTAKEGGSEIGALLLTFYYKEILKDQANYELTLNELAVKCPFFNLLIGDIYLDEYWDRGGEDISSLKKVMEYYYKADAHGMLIPKYAMKLSGLYEYHKDNSQIDYDKQEVERLKRIAKQEL